MCKRAGDATRLHFMLESSLPVTDPIHAGKTNRRIPEKRRRTHARSFSRLVLASIFGLLLLSQALPVLAGWVPAYVRAQGLEIGVLLEWATISEYNLSGFEILCKLESEPDDAYHPIASLPAEGSLDRGAEYSYLVDSGLEVGQTYCFRIQEIALFEEPPEYVDVCGYGLGIEPAITPVPVNPQTGSVEVVATAVFTPPPVQSVDNTPTPITILPSGATGSGAVPGATSAPVDLPPTATPTQFAESSTATPTPTMVGQSPLAIAHTGLTVGFPARRHPGPAEWSRSYHPTRHDGGRVRRWSCRQHGERSACDRGDGESTRCCSGPILCGGDGHAHWRCNARGHLHATAHDHAAAPKCAAGNCRQSHG